jgi:cell division protein FtsB
MKTLFHGVHVTNMRAHILGANLKQETLKIFENIKITMKEKDDEITELKLRVASLEATNELLQNEGNDYKLLIKKQNTLEKKVKLQY